jgi:hypothetical protein
MPMCGSTCACAGCQADRETLLPEIEEMAAAAELLDTVNEVSLDRVLGSLMDGAARSVGAPLPPATARLLRDVVKRTLRRVLPQAGRRPSLVRGRLAPAIVPKAGRLLGIELEGLSPEDMELAAARRAIRFARSAAQRASRASRRLPPRVVASRAAVGAARRWAPGLLPAARARATVVPRRPAALRSIEGRALQRGGDRPGTWIRRGDNIFVIC